MGSISEPSPQTAEMSVAAAATSASAVQDPIASRPADSTPRRTIHEIYAKPAPVQVFPLPTFQPSNPLSVAQLLYTWAKLNLFPPKEAVTMYEGLLFCKSMSVNVVYEKDMFALWQQGFYGKGNLSRSEPNWLKSQQVKKGLKNEHVSEAFTILRREQRKEAKWERARAEQEAINTTRLQEALKKFDDSLVPHSPLSLLALPNSETDIAIQRVELEQSVIASQREHLHSFGLAAPITGPSVPATGTRTQTGTETETLVEVEAYAEPTVDVVHQNAVSNVTSLAPPVPRSPILQRSTVPHSPSALLALPNSQVDLVAWNARRPLNKRKSTIVIDLPSPPMSVDSENSFKSQKHKAVRFSTQVSQTTFSTTAPPSPTQTLSHHVTYVTEEDLKKEHEVMEDVSLVTIEHLQLTFEEAFFLAFALGRLRIVNRISHKPYTIPELFRRFREYSYMPPRVAEPLRPDDPFLINYTIYHHFRSLGFVPRPGMKFGVDWLLYQWGPVFDHAEYGIIVQPAYSSPEWKELGVLARERNWQWFHGVNRTLAHAFKTFVIVYVEVPGPKVFAKAEKKGITEIVRSFRVREFVVKRWSANRNR